MLPYILLGLGLLVIFFDVFLPRAILGIIGGLCILASIVVFIMQSASPTAIFFFIAIAITLFITVVRFKLLRPSKLEKKEDQISHATTQEHFLTTASAKEYIGKRGKAISDLTPAGYVLIDNKRFRAASQSGHIFQNADIIVVDVEELHLIVKRTSPEEKSESPF